MGDSIDFQNDLWVKAIKKDIKKMKEEKK